MRGSGVAPTGHACDILPRRYVILPVVRRGARIATTAKEQGTVAGVPTRQPSPSLRGHSPTRPPWSAPRGRALLGGVAVLAVLLAILVVFTSDAVPPPDPGSAQPLH